MAVMQRPTKNVICGCALVSLQSSSVEANQETNIKTPSKDNKMSVLSLRLFDDNALKNLDSMGCRRGGTSLNAFVSSWGLKQI